MRVMTLLLISALPLLALPLSALPALAQSGEPAVAEDAPQRSTGLPAISVSEVGTRLLRDRVVAGGLVGAVEEVLVQPLVEGQPIETLEADAGDFVDAGQVPFPGPQAAPAAPGPGAMPVERPAWYPPRRPQESTP